MSVLSMSGESEIPHKSLINIEESDEDIPASKKFKSVYTVSLSDKFQTLDFSVKQSKLSNYFQGGQSSLVGFYVLRWAMVVLTGVMVGVIHFIMHAGVTFGSSLKVQWLEVITDGFPQDVWRTYLGLAGFNMIFLGIACALCLFFAMEASGGNVSGVMAYLNGSRIKKFFTIRTVLVKMCSTTAMMCTATPGGMEGPIIHIGAAVGNIAPIVIAKLPLPTKFRTAPSLAYLNSVSERRDLSVCGVAAGVSAGFGAPFGGIFLALEETTTFFSAEMLPRLVVGSFLAKFISDILEQSFVESELEPGEMFYKLVPHLRLAEVLTPENVGLFEFAIVLLYGLTGLIDLMGVPYVEASAPTGSRADVKHLLRQEMEIFQSDLVPRVAHLYDIVQEQKGNYPIVTPDKKVIGDISRCLLYKLMEQKGNYPIVTPDKKVIGDISRCLLYKLMASQVFDAPQPFPEDGYSSLYKIIFTKDCSIEYLQQVRQDMLLNVSEDDKDKLLDLSPFMNKNLFF
ncbi:chloride transport protein 6-like, partial [Diaphorina citri]|uniref:Chloride transport protein 6-like n=1 Tax=Diaphorina citri TaxID=121845 RepID=A0A1S3DJB2_DIACI